MPRVSPIVYPDPAGFAGEAAAQAKALLAAIHESDVTTRGLKENAHTMNKEIVSESLFEIAMCNYVCVGIARRRHCSMNSPR